MNAAVGVMPCSLELLNWRAYHALEMWKLMLPKHITRLDARIWRRFSEVQARRRGFDVRNGGLSNTKGMQLCLAQY